MAYCCHILDILDKLQKREHRTVGPSLVTSLEPLVHLRNVASISLFCRYYFGRCSSELAKLVPFPHSRGRCTRYSNRLHDFPVTILDVARMPRSTLSFLAQLGSGGSLPVECYPWTYTVGPGGRFSMLFAYKI